MYKRQLDTYLPKLVRAGQRVAICEQLEDPKLAKKIVKRGITEMVTPGISYNENVLEHKENNFLAGVYRRIYRIQRDLLSSWAYLSIYQPLMRIDPLKRS